MPGEASRNLRKMDVAELVDLIFRLTTLQESGSAVVFPLISARLCYVSDQGFAHTDVAPSGFSIQNGSIVAI